jgi:NAD(P)H-dependent FMN reductase
MLIQVVSSTTREGRFSEKVAYWVTQHLEAREDFEVEPVDLRRYPLPFFDGLPPAKAPASTPARRSGGWAAHWTGPTGSSC